jgi:hypothetical protein
VPAPVTALTQAMGHPAVLGCSAWPAIGGGIASADRAGRLATMPARRPRPVAWPERRLTDGLDEAKAAFRYRAWPLPAGPGSGAGLAFAAPRSVAEINHDRYRMLSARSQEKFMSAV